MKITVVDKNTHKATFVIAGTNPLLMNCLRRAASFEVPTMAIETVEIIKNSSVLYDEMLGHRLGLIPLKTDLKSYNLPDRCTCKGEGCSKCKLELRLSVTGPKTVYASDLESDNPKVVPAHPKMPIVKLIKGQELEFKATAILGLGKNHVKWSAGLAYYHNKPVITIKGKTEKAELLAQQCPVDVLEAKSGTVSVKPGKLLSCILCKACEDADVDNVIQISSEPQEFVFSLEAWGQLTPKEIMVQSARVLSEKTAKFSEILEGK